LFGALVSLLGITGLFVVVGWFVLVANLIWIIYRITKGLLRLNEDRPMYEV